MTDAPRAPRPVRTLHALAVAAAALAIAPLPLDARSDHDPAAGAGLRRPAPAAIAEAGGPSIAYEEALAWSNVPFTFEPGVPADEPLAPDGSPAFEPDVQSALASDLQSDARADIQAARSAPLRREVFGFLPYWELADAPARVDYDVLSTIAYFSVGADRNGNLLTRNADGSVAVGWAGWRSRQTTDLINRAHRAGTRVVLTLSVFAWTNGQATTQRSILSRGARRARLARQVAATVHERGADGVNLDFEPLVRGMEGEFVSFVRTLRRELDRSGRRHHLTFDTMGSIGNYPIERLVGRSGADAVFVMGYDYRTSRSSRAGSIDPLEGTSYDLTDTVRAYTNRIPANRVILGLPWYGRAWSTATDDVRARNESGTRLGGSVAVPYDAAVDLAARHGRRWDPRERAPWVAYQREHCSDAHGCVRSWRQLYYPDDASLRLRYDLVNRYGLRGTGIWALGYEGRRRELYAALGDKFQDAAVTVQLARNSRTISPNGDGRLDAAVLTFAGRGGSTWRLRIVDRAGRVIRTHAGTGARAAITWHGTRADGSPVPAGPYRFVMTVRDPRGATTTRTIPVSVDLTPPALEPTTTLPAFSPNDDGVADAVELRWTTDERAVGRARVMHGRDVVRAWSVPAGTASAITWDGRDDDGRAVRDGTYRLRLDLRDAAGNAVTREVPVILDRTAGFLRWAGSFFPQDDDGLADEAELRFRLTRAATVTLRIEDAGGRTVRNVLLEREVAAGRHAWTWDGRTGNGSWAEQGRYRAVLGVTTSLGTTVLTRDVYAAGYRTSVPAAVAPGEVLTVLLSPVERLSTEPVVVWTAPGREPVSRRAKPAGDGWYRMAFKVHPGSEGPGTLRISAKDENGRWNTEVLTVSVGG